MNAAAVHMVSNPQHPAPLDKGGVGIGGLSALKGQDTRFLNDTVIDIDCLSDGLAVLPAQAAGHNGRDMDYKSCGN